MQTRFLRGNRTENNGLTLPAGELSIDSETKALRIHDGTTLGGFECVGQPAIPPPPGEDTLLAGDDALGFYGEVMGIDFTGYGDLSTTLGVSAGILHNDAESTWLKYKENGNTLFIAKKTLRYDVSFNDIANTDLQIITIGGLDYEVHLFETVEWDKYLYPIHATDPNSQGWGIGYTDADLNIASGNGHATLTTSIPSNYPNSRYNRGNGWLTNISYTNATDRFPRLGWRPILRLMS